MLQLKRWIGIKNLLTGAEYLVLGLKKCENSLTLTTTTTGSKNSQKEVYNQTDNQNSILCLLNIASLHVLGLV